MALNIISEGYLFTYKFERVTLGKKYITYKNDNLLAPHGALAVITFRYYHPLLPSYYIF